MENKDTGFLLNKKDIELHRRWFKEMCSLIGINVLFRKPLNSTINYNIEGDLNANYEKPVLVSAIFDEYPTLKTTKKLGWNSELQDSPSIIHVPYDLEGLQRGALFIIPSGIDGDIGRVFQVIEMSTTMIYPASVACLIAPKYTNTTVSSQVNDFSKSNFNLLNEEEN